MLVTTYDNSIRKIPKNLLISWCKTLRKLGSPEILWKLCVSIKFSHQEIRWNCGILCIDNNHKLWKEHLRVLLLFQYEGLSAIFYSKILSTLSHYNLHENKLQFKKNLIKVSIQPIKNKPLEHMFGRMLLLPVVFFISLAIIFKDWSNIGKMNEWMNEWMNEIFIYTRK